MQYPFLIRPSLFARIALRTALGTTLAALACVASSAQSSPAEGQQQFAALGECRLDSGQQITDCRLGYRTWGKLHANGSNAVLFPTWFTGTSGQIAGNIGAGK